MNVESNSGTSGTQGTQSFSWWIISLAISVVCCAVLFVVFAGYLVDIKENVAVNKVRLEMSEQRMNEVSAEIMYLRHHNAVQQIQILPSGALTQTLDGGVNVIRGQGDTPPATPAPATTPALTTEKAPAASTTPSSVAPVIPAKP